MTGHNVAEHDIESVMQRPCRFDNCVDVERLPCLAIVVEIEERRKIPRLRPFRQSRRVESKVGRKEVAIDRRVRTTTLSGRPLRTVIEPPEALDVGRVPWGTSWLSDRDRAVLDAAQRPRLVGGLEVLAEAFAAATPKLHADTLTEYARRLGWAAALRRLGSLADTLALEPLAGRLTPIKPITADVDLEPGTDDPTVWRDSRWRVRWPRTVDELVAVIDQ